MYLTSEAKKKIYKEYGGSESHTGTSEGQIAVFSTRITRLTQYLQENPKDVNTKRSLVGLVNKRRRLLEYLKSNHIERYRAIIKKLDIRK